MRKIGRLCRERDEIVVLREENARLRTRAYRASYTTPGTHSTACITWGDDGQGGLADGGNVPNGVCSCGAWPAWLERENARLRAALEEAVRIVGSAHVGYSPYPVHVANVSVEAVDRWRAALRGHEPVNSVIVPGWGVTHVSGDRLAEAIRLLEDGHCTYGSQGPTCPNDHVTATCDVCRTVAVWKAGR